VPSIGNPDNPIEVMENSRRKVVGESTPLRFPSEAARYFTMLRFVEYKRDNPKKFSLETGTLDVILPLPSNLNEYYNISYGDDSFNQFGGVQNTVEQIYNDWASKGGSTASSFDVEGAASAFTGWSQALARGTANYFSPELGGVIDRATGNVVNPHITSVFKGVALREHSFQWRLSAKSAKESAIIKNIRDSIRNRMHPEKKSEFLLNFPDEVYIKFFADGKPFLYPIFKSVVTAVASNLSSDGTNAFFKDTDEPVIIDLSITFKEVEAVTREDFTNQSTTRTNSTPQITTPAGAN
jgi:hypothetical protein